MQNPVPRSEPSLNYQKELEARVHALEAIVGALLRFAAGQQDLANALKEARQRSEAYMRDPANQVLPEDEPSYRGSFHTLAVSMIPLGDLESFRANLPDRSAANKARVDEDPYCNFPT